MRKVSLVLILLVMGMIASSGIAFAEVKIVTSYDAWNLVEVEDEMTDEKIYYINTISYKYRRILNLRLPLSCNECSQEYERQFSIYTDRCVINNEYIYFRIDKNEMVMAAGNVDRKMNFIWFTVGYNNIQQMKRGSRLLIKISCYSNVESGLDSFSLNGFTKAFDALEKLPKNK